MLRRGNMFWDWSPGEWMETLCPSVPRSSGFMVERKGCVSRSWTQPIYWVK